MYEAKYLRNLNPNTENHKTIKAVHIASAQMMSVSRKHINLEL